MTRQFRSLAILVATVAFVSLTVAVPSNADAGPYGGRFNGGYYWGGAYAPAYGGYGVYGGGPYAFRAPRYMHTPLTADMATRGTEPVPMDTAMRVVTARTDIEDTVRTARHTVLTVSESNHIRGTNSVPAEVAGNSQRYSPLC